LKNNLYTLEGLIVCRKGDIMEVQLLHLVILKIPLGEHFSDLSSSVGPKIKTYNEIPLFYTANGPAQIVYLYNGADKFICNSVVIGFPDRVGDIFGTFAFSMYQSIISQLHTFPSFVPVHGIISSYHRGNSTDRLGAVALEILEVSQSPLRVCVSSISKSMNKHILDAIVIRRITQPL